LKGLEIINGDYISAPCKKATAEKYIFSGKIFF